MARNANSEEWCASRSDWRCKSSCAGADTGAFEERSVPKEASKAGQFCCVNKVFDLFNQLFSRAGEVSCQEPRPLECQLELKQELVLGQETHLRLPCHTAEEGPSAMATPIEVRSTGTIFSLG